MKLALLLALQAAAPSSPTVAPMSPAGQTPAPAWGVDWGAEYCTLSRRTEGDASLTYGIRVMPGKEVIELLLVGPRVGVPDFNSPRATVAIEPGGEPLQATVMDGVKGTAERIVKLYLPGYTLINRLAQAREVRIEGGKAPVTLPIPAASKAAASLKECMQLVAAEWGVDTNALSGLSKWPAMKGHFIGANDYPGEALGKGASGRVLARLTIGVQGKVTRCAVVVPSGEKSLDEATCRLALTRGSFEPALGANGVAVEATIILPVEWRHG